MNQKVFILSNTFPYGGEPFLKTEIECLDDISNIFILPFFSSKTEISTRIVPQQNVHEFNNQISIWQRIYAGVNSVKNLIVKKELKETIHRGGKARNIVKALKFAYISELRVYDAVRYINREFGDNSHMLFYAYWMYETAYVGARLKTMYPNCTFITRCHGYDLYESRHPNGYLPFRSFILKTADMICPISENGKEYLKKLYGIEIDNKTQIARLGTIRKAEIPERQEKEDSLVLVSCSNLVDVKRVHLIINALMNCHQNVHWYHFGAGVLREKLEAQAKVLPDHVEYTFMGYQANEDVQKFYADHYIDAFINVSQSEGIPVSIMEAESYGIPVIATDVGGTSEIVHDKVDGVLLDVNFTNNDLLVAIDEVVEKGDQYRLEAFHTWETMSDAHKVFPEFYKKLAEV